VSVRFDLVIFDCDGVLIESEILSIAAEARVFSRHGLPVDADFVFEHCTGLSWKSELAFMEEHFQVKLPESISAEAAAEIEHALTTKLVAMAGIEAALDALAIPVCVASSSTPERLRLSLGKVGLYDRLAPHIFSSTMVKNGKPAPDLFLYTAEKMSAAPSRCVVIEDSLHGVNAAKAAGMTAVGFTGGAHIRKGHDRRLLEAGADHLVTHHDLLVAALA
jgi:HAD superfamily hydrolase (TIGR01509 family)